jgi:hypothetical protein
MTEHNQKQLGTTLWAIALLCLKAADEGTIALIEV